MANVTFKEGTSSAYSKITPDSHTFYYTTDTDQVYLGSVSLVADDDYIGTDNFAAFSCTISVSSPYTYTKTYSSSSSSSIPSHLAYALNFIVTNTTSVAVSEWSITRNTASVTVTITLINQDLSTSSISVTPYIYLVYYKI